MRTAIFTVGYPMCHVSLAAMLILPCLRGASAMSPEDEVFLGEIWQNAWDLVYTPNQSGMTINWVADGDSKTFWTKLGYSASSTFSCLGFSTDQPAGRAGLTPW